MFVGHYSASFALKAAKPRVPLWVLFIAVQAVDVGWGTLMLLGVEKANYVPGNSVHQYLLAARKAATLEQFEVTYSSGHVSSFSGYVKKFERSGEPGKEVSADVAVKISGAVTDP